MTPIGSIPASAVHPREDLLYGIPTGCAHEVPGIPDRHLVRIPFERLDRLGNERIEGHRLGSDRDSRLALPSQIRGDVRRDQLDDLDAGSPQLVPRDIVNEWTAALVAQ